MLRLNWQFAVLHCIFLSLNAQSLPKFVGRDVTIIKPELDGDGFPKGPASVCVDGPQRQCYTAPKEFGSDPSVEIIELEKNLPALFFSAASSGGSGFLIHFALLGPGEGKELQDSFTLSLGNQSQHAFWADSSISPAKIFVTAEYVWGPDESHYGPHRYIVSAYVRKPPNSYNLQASYYLDDRFMTTRKYDLDTKVDILNSEKQEIIARLKRVNQQGSH